MATLTEIKSIADYEERKREHLQRIAVGDERAGAIFAADKLVNLQDMLRAYEVEGELLGRRFNGTVEQKETHVRENIAVLRSIPGVSDLPIFSELVATAAAFRQLRAGESEPVEAVFGRWLPWNKT